MELREYMSIRRAYNLVRQSVPTKQRITFEEYAILAHLYNGNKVMKTSDIAKYQGVLRPTMTHRTNHLYHMGFISRQEGTEDKRNVCCVLTDEGEQFLSSIAEQICKAIPKGYPLHRINAYRVTNYVDAMGSYFLTAGDLSLLSLYMLGGTSVTVNAVVESMGLLQPTVSMSISALVEQDLCKRKRNVDTIARTVSIELTKAGKDYIEKLVKGIEAVVVHRHRAPKPAVTQAQSQTQLVEDVMVSNEAPKEETTQE